jgi:hypothetical protein
MNDVLSDHQEKKTCSQSCTVIITHTYSLPLSLSYSLLLLSLFHSFSLSLPLSQTTSLTLSLFHKHIYKHARKYTHRKTDSLTKDSGFQSNKQKDQIDRHQFIIKAYIKSIDTHIPSLDRQIQYC